MGAQGAELKGFSLKGSSEGESWTTALDLKGQCHEIFYLWFFFANNVSWPQ
jgi:hypothetical protein